MVPMDEFFHIADLIVKRIRGKVTASEQEELDRWISESPENQELFDRASHPGKQLEKAEIYKLFDRERAWTRLEDELFAKETIRFAPRRWMRYAAAILLPLIVGGGFAWWYLRAPSTQTLAEIDLDIQPGSQKAMLILSDGKRIELRNFGIFHVKKRKRRIARNPKTGEVVPVPERLAVVFKPGLKMKLTK